SYVEFANSPQQEAIAALMDEGSSPSAIAASLGLDQGNARRAVRLIKARSAGKTITEHSCQIPDGYKIKGTSTLYKDGQPSLQWVKTSVDAERQAEMMRAVV